MLKLLQRGDNNMRNFKVKTTVIKNFNDSKTGISYEKDEPITLDRKRNKK